MNLVHLKYAVEVAETGSINKASEKLYVSQPNLSRAIKELEASLGVTIFDRSAKGMVLTPDGEVLFVTPARYSVRSTLSKKCSARVRPRRKILDIRAEGELCDRRIRRVLKASRQGHAG